MSAVWYTGRASKRTITMEEWQAAGLASTKTHIWSEDNGFSLDTSEFTAPQLAILSGLNEFTVNAPDGPIIIPEVDSDSTPATQGYVLNKIASFGAALAAKLDKVAGPGNSFSLNPAGLINRVGPGASLYNLFGGDVGFPHFIGNAKLAFLSGYDNKIWDNAIATFLTGHHDIVGGTSGHPASVGGSMGVNFGGYGFKGGGNDIKVFSNYSVNIGGFQSSAGATVIALLADPASVGGKSIVVDNAAGIVVGQKVYIGGGTTALSTAYGDGPLERATVTSIVGTTINLGSFFNTDSTNDDGTSSAVAFASVHPAGTKAYFVTGAGSTTAVVLGGNNSDATGPGSFTHGTRNKVSGTYAVGLGADGDSGKTAGTTMGQGAATRRAGQVAYANGLTAGTGVKGEAQGGFGVQRIDTTTAAPVSLVVWTGIPSGTVFRWSVKMMAINLASGEVKTWDASGVARCIGTTVTLIQGPANNVAIPAGLTEAGTEAWVAAILTGSASFNLRLTGEAKNIRWIADTATLELVRAGA